MDFPVSAFSIYKSQTKKKHKASPQNESKQPPLKKKKQVVLKNTKKPIIGISSKKKKNKPKALTSPSSNGYVSSEEEIPTLVPIIDIPEVHAPMITNNEKKTLKVKKKSVKSKDIKPFNPVTQGLALFKWMLDPVTPADFFKIYWEQKVLHVNRSKQEYFKDVFSTKKLDSILREFPLHYTRNIDVVVYKDGKKEVMEEEGRALPSKLWYYYETGCSIRVLNPQTYDQDVHSVISSLQEYFGTMVGANVYLTPPDSQGFAPHFDDIEAFIIQLEGSKYWKLYKPKDEDVLARDSSQNFNAKDLGPPFMEVKLNAGDVLYFPRGTIHEGHTKEEHSLHITVSVYQHTAYADLLEHALPAALKRAARENIDFRKGLPLNYLKHLGVVNKSEKSAKRELIVKQVKSLMGKLVDYLDVDGAADQLGRKFMHDAMPPLYSKEEAENSSKFDGDFMEMGKVYNRVEISTETKVRLLRYYALRVVQEADTSKLYFCTDNAKTYHGEEEQWMEIDDMLIPGVEMLQKSYPDFIVVDNLPIDDEAEKLSLVYSLWEHGMIVTDGPLEPFPFD
ncbi:ribosomal oxygenase 1 [Anthonomus grandis grandis]|uniref:ribosomal oxygenase 1 n=1 Tax=Anthonomus grandis grandis TaxID=2921223 RepID=UPI0021663AC1|nr:ribosomal oxygenase 1 [Anthonomus grandis grandis]